MHSISPARAMARQTRRYYQYGLVLLLAGLFVGALGVMTVVIPLTRAVWYGTVQGVLLIGGVVLVLVGAGLIARARLLPSDNMQALQAAEVLKHSLDARYALVRNVSGRGLGYIDAVLLGPQGALVFYFVSRPGVFYCEAETWLVKKGGQFVPAGIGPTYEAAKDARALRRHLAQRYANPNDPTQGRLDQVPVFAMIVLTHPSAAVTTHEPVVVPATHLRNLMAAIQSTYLAGRQVEPGLIQAILRLLVE